MSKSCTTQFLHTRVYGARSWSTILYVTAKEMEVIYKQKLISDLQKN